MVTGHGHFALVSHEPRTLLSTCRRDRFSTTTCQGGPIIPTRKRTLVQRRSYRPRAIRAQACWACTPYPFWHSGCFPERRPQASSGHLASGVLGGFRHLPRLGQVQRAPGNGRRHTGLRGLLRNNGCPAFCQPARALCPPLCPPRRAFCRSSGVSHTEGFLQIKESRTGPGTRDLL